MPSSGISILTHLPVARHDDDAKLEVGNALAMKEQVVNAIKQKAENKRLLFMT